MEPRENKWGENSGGAEEPQRHNKMSETHTKKKFPSIIEETFSHGKKKKRGIDRSKRDAFV